MSVVNIRNSIRCFCSFLAKRTNDNTYVCGRYKSGGMVCLFHLHNGNVENYYQPNLFPMSLDCDMCLATIKIHSKEYIAPCRVPSVRCYCGDVATFYQSKKENANNNMYFFGCPNWKVKTCRYFAWAHEYQSTRNIQILSRLISPSLSAENPVDVDQSCKRTLDDVDDAINAKKKDIHENLECAICLSAERTYMITPCNHLCCCSTCANRIEGHCPICRHSIGSIQRVFLV